MTTLRRIAISATVIASSSLLYIFSPSASEPSAVGHQEAISEVIRENSINKIIEHNDEKTSAWAAGELIIKFKSSLDESIIKEHFKDSGFSLAQNLSNTDNLWLVEFDNSITVKDALVKLKDFEDIIHYAERNMIGSINSIPSDPYYDSQWSLTNESDTDIDAPELWEIYPNPSEVIIGVIDTGIDYAHEDLSSNVWVNPNEIPSNGIDDDGNGYIDDIYGIDAHNQDSNPLDDHNHGTHVSGTIAAQSNNNYGISGIHKNAKIVSCKAFDANGFGSISSAITCLNYFKALKLAGNKIVVTNNSYGFSEFSQAFMDAVQQNIDAGIGLVAAAGNDSTDLDVYTSFKQYPSLFEINEIINVASIEESGGLSYFSNYGAGQVDIAAPGSSIYSTIVNGYAYMSGTSMASPHVAGAYAIIASHSYDLTVSEIKQVILDDAKPLDALIGKVSNGTTLKLSTPRIDSDNDGIPDYWEDLHSLNKNEASDALLDSDEDGLTNLEEYENQTNPSLSDSDGDGLTDGEEVNTHNTNPNSADSDQDGLNDYIEINTHNTDPLNSDSDNDGLSDYAEINIHQTDPNLADTDEDGESDGKEIEFGYDPNDPDSRPVILSKFEYGFDTALHSNWSKPEAAEHTWEILTLENGQKVLSPTEISEYKDTSISLKAMVEQGHLKFTYIDYTYYCCKYLNLYINNSESYLGTTTSTVEKVAIRDIPEGSLDLTFEYEISSLYSNTDRDKIWIDDIRYLASEVDTDKDFMDDSWEIDNGLDPANSDDGTEDLDGDLVSNEDEFWAGTNINNVDSDNDGMDDGFEIKYGLNPLDNTDAAGDLDEDSINNLEEFNLGTQPNNPDSDNDGLSDANEINTHLTDPTNLDSDADGYADGFEINSSTDPLDSDSVPDGIRKFSYDFESGDMSDWTNNEESMGWSISSEDSARGRFALKSDLTQTSDFSEILVSKVTDQGQFSLSYKNLSQSYAGINGSLNEINFSSANSWQSLTINVNQGLNDFTLKATASGSFSPSDVLYIDEIRFLSTAIDRDGDLMMDTWERSHGLNDAYRSDGYSDNDSDGLKNIDEYWAGSDPTNGDTDADGLGDLWEYSNALNPADASDATHDNDEDGLNNIQELEYGTHPLKSDSDSDGLSDYEEIFTYLTDPTTLDSDNDGLNDHDEIHHYLTDPLNTDSDEDGADDGHEVVVGLDPNDPESKPIPVSLLNISFEDGNIPHGMVNQLHNDVDWQVIKGSAYHGESSLKVNFSDENQKSSIILKRYFESGRLYIHRSTKSANLSIKLDNAQAPNIESDYFYETTYPVEEGVQEIIFTATNYSSTNSYAMLDAIWFIADSQDTNYNNTPDDWESAQNLTSYDEDNDGMSNFYEYWFGTDPHILDSDLDGMPDGWEFTNRLSPSLSSDKNLDPDGDGVSNILEFTHGSKPNQSDSDYDGLSDFLEIFTHGTDPSQRDTDQDSLSDKQEITTYYTDPKKVDTDGDFAADNIEIQLGNSPINAADSPPYYYGQVFDFESGSLPLYWTNQYSFHLSNRNTIAGDWSLVSRKGYSSSYDFNALFVKGQLSLDYKIINPNSNSYIQLRTNNITSTETALQGSISIEIEKGYFNTRIYFYGRDDDAHVIIDNIRFTPADTDNDGMPDFWEINEGLDPLNSNDGSTDSDNDGLTNAEEYQHGTNRLLADTDNDGLPDLWETSKGTKALLADDHEDYDLDNLNNLEEWAEGTDPLRWDTDDDGLSDSWELEHGLDPLVKNYFDTEPETPSEPETPTEPEEPVLPDTDRSVEEPISPPETKITTRSNQEASGGSLGHTILALLGLLLTIRRTPKRVYKVRNIIK